MRLLMLNNEFPPLGGGMGTVTLAMLEQFERIPGLEIDLITSALGSRTEEDFFASTIKTYKVPVRNKNIHHSSNRELSEYFIRGLWLALNLQRQRSFNICFAWSAVPAGAIALVLRHIVGLRYIVRVCGPDIPGFERRYHTIHRFLCPLIRRIWHGAERVIAKSEHEIEMIHAVDPTLDCLLVPNGVDGNRFKPISDAPDDGPLRLLCVGRLIERKGQHHLIEAVKRLTDEKIDVRLDLVGTGDARSDNEALVAQLGLADRIRFLGYVPREVIAEHYAAAHVFVLPSYNEGMSVALLEAMASALAVVATRTAVTPELVESEVNGLVFDWGDVDRLTAHLRSLAQDRSALRRMGTASRQRAAGYSWDRAALRYIELLKRLTDIAPQADTNVGAEAKHKVSF
jgi:glycosyltransferase involved in cell wall biosynthesis